MSKRSTTTTEDYLTKAPLPEATDTYTVIPHATIIKKVRETLTEKGFEIERELYRCNENAQVAQGVYHLKYGDDPDMGMMFAWSNSYDKSMRFKCSIGAYVHASLANIIGGNMGTFGRKHTGTADEEVYATIEEQINNAETFFNQLVLDKENMKNIVAPETLRAEFMGRAYFTHEILTGEQMAMVKAEFRKPSFQYSGVQESLWEMYNAIVYSLQKSHPRSWMDQQRVAHYNLCKDFNIPQDGSLVPSIADVPTNQLNIIDAIKEAEQESTAEQIVQEEKQPLLPCSAHALEQEQITEEKDSKEVVSEVEIIPGLTLEKVTSEVMEKFPVTMEKIADEPVVETAVAPEETFLPETQPAVEEDGWPCMKCGEMQGADAIFYDGQLCGKCYEH